MTETSLDFASDGEEKRGIDFEALSLRQGTGSEGEICARLCTNRASFSNSSVTSNV